jgi:hypothetical protein
MTSIQANAWTGAATLAGPQLDRESSWALKQRIFLPKPSTRFLLPEQEPDERDWSHPKVGWGLVLADDDALSDADKAVGADAPPALQKLLRARNNAPVLRYRGELMNGFLRRYFADGSAPSDLDVAASHAGVAENAIPKYLLIYGSPTKIPWRTQYALNMSRRVGRLDLEHDELDRYVECLIGEWAGVPCNPLAPVAWSVNFGAVDITYLMQQVIAEKFWQSVANDHDFTKAVQLKDGAATGSALAAATAERRPGLVVTTSHGMTGPENKPGSVPSELGLLVDANHGLLTPDVLPDTTIPGGAIWYAHACCSAGSDTESQCAGLFPPGHPIGDTLRAVSANAGACIAPFARRLLGAKEPLRAFVGHVEPTFDWMLRDPNTGQVLGDSLACVFYNRLYQKYEKGTPIGHALAPIYAQAGSFLTQWRQAIDKVNKDEPGAAELARYWQVAALDRQSMVIIGDPTVSLALS